MEKRAILLEPSAQCDIGALESDHRVANSLALISAQLRLQREQSTDDAVQSALHSAEVRVSNAENFHKYLHSHAASDRINLNQYLCEIMPVLDAGIGVQCVLAFDPGLPIEVSASVARSLAIVVNELALNAHKYAYGGKPGGCVTIELGRDGCGVKLEIADGGPGLPDQFSPESRNGLGMRIVSSLVREMEGSLTYYSDGGAHFTIRIPAS